MLATGRGQLWLLWGLSTDMFVLTGSPKPAGMGPSTLPAPVLAICCMGCAVSAMSSSSCGSRSTPPGRDHCCWGPAQPGAARSSDSLWAKKHMLRVQASPELHMVVRYLQQVHTGNNSSRESISGNAQGQAHPGRPEESSYDRPPVDSIICELLQGLCADHDNKLQAWMAGLWWHVPVWVQPALEGVARIQAALAVGALLVLQYEWNTKAKAAGYRRTGQNRSPLKLGYTGQIHADCDCLLCRRNNDNGARLLPHWPCCNLAVFMSV